ncbi:MAG TPA: FtsW/RodA/SpoVE family cell cycle protein [Candidatus Methylacidiphilales bacterium]|jgi:rod shape determining protein RodA|nr:FtsW/RodA/SpoVE family cell cycle protein [Candidatus Methylacidiphilales bacterium]
MRALFRKLGQVGWSFPIILALVTLCIASLFAITSATSNNPDHQDAAASQSKYVIAGFVIYLAVALTPYKVIVRISPILYAVGVCLLVACFIPHIGRVGHGANSWIRIGKFGFEPAEFAKLAYILGLAWFLRVRENRIQHLSTVLMAMTIAFVPFVLVLKQPALGTASVFFPVCFAMLFAAGARLHHLLIPLALVAAVVVLSYYWIHVWDKPVPFLKDFQVFRVKVFFDPSLDPKGVGYQAAQATIALGSGGIDGKGWRQGAETALGFLPRAATDNDLIFPVVGEDFGFRGGALLIIFEGIVLLWCLFVAARARDKIGALLAVGVMTMLFTHTFVNIGMNIQLVPITGIPLPFVSYGGTFLIACLAAMGLVQSVWVHRKNFERI